MSEVNAVSASRPSSHSIAQTDSCLAFRIWRQPVEVLRYHSFDREGCEYFSMRNRVLRFRDPAPAYASPRNSRVVEKCDNLRRIEPSQPEPLGLSVAR